MTLRVEPMALGGRFLLNWALTRPLFPCDLVILPQITLNFVLFLTLLPL